MLEAVIFDMDGVLIDSEAAITEAALEALSEYGIKADFEDFKQFTGMGDDLFVGGVARLHGGEYKPEMKYRAYELYKENAASIHVYPWTRKLIEDVTAVGLKKAVASAADQIKVDANLKVIGVSASDFSAVITGIDVKNKKPAPDIFLAAAKAAGVAPQNCVVVEDALSGVRAAKAAGMLACAVTTSFSASELISAGADHVTDALSLDEILKTAEHTSPTL